MDPSGTKWTLFRIKDLRRSGGGENIRRVEIEELSATHLMTVTSSVPDRQIRRRAHMAVAQVEKRRRNHSSSGCASTVYRIARFKIPAYLWIVDEFLMTVTGEVRKVDATTGAFEYLRGQQ